MVQDNSVKLLNRQFLKRFLTNIITTTNVEMTDSIVDEITDPSKLFLSDASANIMKQLELTKYTKDSGMFTERVNVLEDMLRGFFQTQEDYSKYLEIQLTVQQERCVELTDKWHSAENQSRTN